MEIRELLIEIDRLKAEIDVLRPIDPAQERRVMQKFRLDWTYHSNAIEGNTLTYGETRAFLLHGITAQGKPFRDYLEVKGHHEAINYLLEFVQQKNPLTEADIRELHKMILVEPYEIDAVTADGRATKRRVIPGQYKSAPNHVITSTGEMHYYATPEETPAKMGDLMAWFRRETDKAELHPLILAATFHYQFVVIHPFDDGNGRMARLLMNLIFLQYGYPPVIIPLDKKGDYLLALETADATNNLDAFIAYIGNALLHSLDLFLRGAKGEIIEEVDDLDKKIALLQKRLEASTIAKFSAVENFIDAILSPFIGTLFSQLTKFNQLFTNNLYEISFGNQERLISIPGGNITSTIRQLEGAIKTGTVNVNLVKVGFSWLKYDTNQPFQIDVMVSIYLREKDFLITCALHSPIKNIDESTVFQGTYGKTYRDEFQKPVLDIANAVYQVVDQILH